MENIIGQGAVLMVIGMGVVFAFLTLLVISMNCSAAFFKKYAHLFPEEPVQGPARKTGTDCSDVALAVAMVRHHTN
jgi:sodium pump decarboxylase gamma subunit